MELSLVPVCVLLCASFTGEFFITAEDGEIILGIQGDLVTKSNDSFYDVDPPSHGLYSLGTVPGNGFIESVCVSGAYSGHEGAVYIFIIDDINSKLRGDGYKVSIISPSRRECKRKFDDELRNNDQIAVYITNSSLRLQISFEDYAKNNTYKFLEHFNKINETKRKTIRKDLKEIIKKGRGEWKELDPTLELNIQVKISLEKRGVTKKNKIIKIVSILGVVAIVFGFLAVIVLLFRWKIKDRIVNRDDMILETHNTEMITNTPFSNVQYLLQKGTENVGKGKTVININYHNFKHHYKGPKESHEYSLLTEADPVSHQPLTAFDKHDYDEPYFEPALKEEELIMQLKNLSVPVVGAENLKLFSEDLLGSGAFGSVYRGTLTSGSGTHQQMEEEVAVKTMENNGASEEDRVKFLQEAAIMGQFHHPNTIKILGVVIEKPYKIILDVMTNGDLRRHLQDIKSGDINPELAPTLLSYSRHVANGMMYLEVKSFIHRDLAARNILVAEDGVCKIADFGLSRELNEDFYMSHGGKIPVKWTAPEALHYRKYSTASDVWSYGCVLYEIWSLGEKPYSALTNDQVIEKIMEGFRLSPPPGCPRDVYHIMMQCWNQDAPKRPTFMDITALLQKPDFLVLKWSEDEVNGFSQTERTLGGPLEAGWQLHKDLQATYVTE